MPLIDFLRHPVENAPADNRPSQLLKTFGWFCLLQLVGLIGTGLFVLLWEAHLPLRDALADNTFRGVLIAVLIAPLLEEAMFRLPLRRNRVTLLIALAISLFGIVSAACGIPAIRSAERLPLRLAWTSCLLPPLWLAVKRVVRMIRFPYYFYLMAALFALAHLLNVEFHALHITVPAICFLVWYIAEKFVAGTLYGYARLKHGFAAVCCLHALNNAIPCVLIVIFDGFFGA